MIVRRKASGEARETATRHLGLGEAFKVRRSRQSDFRAMGLWDFQDESVISSRLPHSGQRKVLFGSAGDPNRSRCNGNETWPGWVENPSQKWWEEGMDEMSDYFWPRKILVGFVDPIGARGIEHIEVDGVFKRLSLVRHVGWDAEHFAGVD